MPRKKQQPQREKPAKMQGFIAGAGEIVQQDISDTLRQNFMPYAMSVIMSRAIPEIDGFKPSHRKLLYTMYKMGLLGSARTKSANIVGQTMKLNPHGDAAIYDTMVRLSRGYEALLHPYVDSKGNFGKVYSRDMAWAASRYTEARLDPICRELFQDIDKDTVDFVDNYDNTMKEPTLLPATFPTVLVNANTGIAVGMASNICPFNLAEVCQAAIARMRDPEADLFQVLQAPDFPGGGQLIFDREQMGKIYDTGRGSFRVRSRWAFDKSANCIDITQIPPTTTIEAIMDKVIDLIKAGRIREIADMRDETDLSGLKITIDLKRGTDPDKLMQKLFRLTPLEDNFSCNFNVLVGGMPKVMGVGELLSEWIAFREDCVKRRIYFDLTKKKEKLHLLRGLEKILLDIDKAIRIVRETEEEREVVPNLMIGFGIDETQAEFVAEIRLRQLNREYILKRTDEIGELEKDIAEMESTLQSRRKIRSVITSELRQVIKKYSQPRKSILIFPSDEPQEAEEDDTPDYPVNLFFTREGYFKKITNQSLRMSADQKLKEGDSITQSVTATNRSELLFFTDKCQVYKTTAADFDDTKASVLGDYLPAKLGMDSGENPVFMAVTTDYQGYLLFAFENGKAAKVPLSAYATKTRRRKLANAYSDKARLVQALQLSEDCEVLFTSSDTRMLIVHSGLIPAKVTKDTQGVAVMALKKKHLLVSARIYDGGFADPKRYMVRTLPGAGALPKDGDATEQLTLA